MDSNFIEWKQIINLKVQDFNTKQSRLQGNFILKC
jgi:hypothetical protein